MVRRPLRTFLVLQGVMWGSAVAIMPPAIIEGSRQAMIRKAGEIGTDRMVVVADTMDPSNRISLDDFRHLEKMFGGSFVSMSPFRARRAFFRRGSMVAEGWAVGSNPGELKSRNLALSSGTFHDGVGMLAALEPGVARDLELGPLSEGATIDVVFAPESLGGDPLVPFDPGTAKADLAGITVTGFLEPLPEERLAIDDFGMKRDHFLSGLTSTMMTNMGVAGEMEPWRISGRAVHMPLNLVPAERDSIDMIILRAKPEKILDSIRDLQKSLSARGRAAIVRWNLMAPVLLAGKADRYIRLRYATFLLCLAMGAIVISNVMLLSVMESWRDIAIRRVEGATKADIVLMYVVQSGVQAVVGGLAGLPAGMLIARLRIMIAPAAGMGVVFPVESAAIAMACTVAAGLIAGVLPAMRAASMDPVAALRNE